MPASAENVYIVFVPDFGEQAGEFLAEGPVWLCDSAINRHAAERFWSSKTLPPGYLTVFDMGDAGSNEKRLLEILDTIDEHHPSWKRLDVSGATAGSAVASRLAEYGRGLPKEREKGFTFDRS